MTNGEKIKELFPHFDVEDKTEYFGRLRNLDDHFIKADIDFWNAEYKESTTKNDLGVDCIDRQTAITFVCKNTEEILKDTIPLEVKLSDDYLYENIAKIMRNPKVLPSVTPQEQKTERFAKWVATEIFSDMWEYNKDTFVEIACRKLAKLGIVRAKGDEWELIEPQESEDKG